MAVRPSSARGAALPSVPVTVAVLTALAANLAYDSRVALRIAANARDELRASYQARSAVALGRMVLSFQQQVDEAAGSVTGGGVRMPRLQLWRAIPVSSELLQGLFAGGRPLEPEGTARAAPATFDAVIEDEALKVSAQLDASAVHGALAAQVSGLYHLICDPRWDPLFDREDANGFKSSREDLIVRLKDWVDEGEVSAELKAAFAGVSCGMVPDQAAPFVQAFGDESQPYDRGERDQRYRTKNGRMDSLDELFLVAGVSDAFMAAFGEALTVYLPRDAKQNVNTNDPRVMVNLARRVAQPQNQPLLQDPAFPEKLAQAVQEKTFGGIFSISPAEFGQCLEAAGVRVNAAMLTGPNSPFTDRSTTFRIRGRGSAGDVQSAVDAVVRLEKAAQGEPVAAPGRVIYWREE